jgi:GDP-L-fucose synthase
VEADARVFVAGGQTLIGAALLRRLTAQGHTHIVGAGCEEPDPADDGAVERFFEAARPEFVFVAAGRTAGIGGNLQFPVDLMTDNLTIAGNLIPAAWRARVRKLVYLSSSCTYPKHAPQPLQVSSLWTGPLEPTSASYAAAKLAAMQLCDAFQRQHGAAFISAICADAYGPGDDFSPENAHVVAALMRRMHDAKHGGDALVSVWGSGTPQREFIYVDDLADAAIHAMRRYEGPHPINLGTGEYTSIADLAAAIQEVVGYRGALQFDRTRPDGMPFKGLDSSALHALGWRPAWTLRRGLKQTYDWFHATS